MNQIKASSVLIMLSIGFAALIIPLHSTIIDILLLSSIGITLIVYFQSATIKEWSDITSFPSILLYLAIFRIAMNFATTKKILTDGEPGVVIETIGGISIGDSIAVGAVVFLVLIVFQFILANSASRTSEVAARFVLDSLPGKQMSIDSDLQQRLITEKEARDRRRKLDMQVDFFGRMDGVGKFVKGDVILGLLLTIINITAGLIIGMMALGMTASEAAIRFTTLTIGDGIISQMCSLALTVSMGAVIAKVDDGEKKASFDTMAKQVLANPLVLNVVGGMFVILGLIAGILMMSLFGIGFLALGYFKQKSLKKEEEQEQKQRIFEEQQKAEMEQEKVEVITEIEPITLEVGIALVPLVTEDKKGETLKEKIAYIRQTLARELGVKIPSIHVMDNATIMPYTRYNIMIKDHSIASGELRVNSLMAIPSELTANEDIEGQPTKEPIFGQNAYWINEDTVEEAKEKRFGILDPLTVLTTHLEMVIRKNLHELLTRTEVQELLSYVEQRHKILIEQINEKKIDISIIQGVLKNLLMEDISIRDLSSILEAIIDCDTHKKVENMSQIDNVTYVVRENLRKSICNRLKSENGKLYIIMLDQQVEANDKNTLMYHGQYYTSMPQNEEQELAEALRKEVEKVLAIDAKPVILTSRIDLRFAMAKMLEKYNIPASVLSQNEIAQDIKMHYVGTAQLKSSQAG